MFGKGSEGPRSTGDINILGLSFSFYQMWLYISIFSVSKAFGPSDLFPDFPAFPLEFHGMLVYIYLLTSAILLIGFSAFSKKLWPFFGSKSCVVFSCILMSAGSLLLFFAPLSALIVFLAGMLMGAGTSMLIIQFGIIFSSFDFATCVLNAGSAFAIGFICADIIVNWIPSPISGSIAAIVPLLLMIVMIRNRPTLKAETEGEIPIKYVRSYLISLVLSMVFLGFVEGALRVVCGDKMLSSGDLVMELIVGVGCMVSVAVLALAIALSKRSQLWDSLLKNVTPFIMIGIACISLLAGDFSMIATFFTVIGFACLGSLIWILLASFARNLNGSHVFVFGLGYGVVQGISILGAMLANFLSSQGMFQSDPSSMQAINILDLTSQLGLSDLAIVLMVVMAIGYSLTPRYRELKEVLISVVMILSDELASKASVASIADRAHEASGDEKDSRPEGASIEDASDAASEDDEEEGGSWHTGQPFIEGFPEGEQTRNEQVKPEPIQREQGLRGHSGQPFIEGFNFEEPERKGSFKRRCDELSDKYKLSAREREAFSLLAKGHNAAYLTEEMCISRATAKTHINHIYKKLGIHTQQELLNMVEDRQRGPRPSDLDKSAIHDVVSKVSEEQDRVNPAELIDRIRQLVS